MAQATATDITATAKPTYDELLHQLGAARAENSQLAADKAKLLKRVIALLELDLTGQP